MRHSSITAKGDTAQVLIYEDIGEGFFGGLGAKAFREQIDALPSSVSTLNVRINSDGGDVFEGTAIYNTLKDHPAQKNVIIDGIAASIASVIAMAGDSITIQPTAMMMIHNARAMSFGDCVAMRQVADLLETVNQQMAVAYSRSKLSTQAILDIMGAETWYTAQGAVDAGWADSLVAQPLKMAASLRPFNLSAFAKVPDWAKQLQAASPDPDDGCECTCGQCVAGLCNLCSNEDCDDEDCEDCLQQAARAAKNIDISAENAVKALKSAQMRAEYLRLAEAS